MRVLFDTHALAWWILNSDRLSPRARSLAMSEENQVLISVVTAFEMTTKYRVGKWPDIGPLVADFEAAIAAEGFSLLHLGIAPALLAGNFRNDHRDPFDRLLAAQSMVEKLPLVTSDPAFKTFGVETLW